MSIKVFIFEDHWMCREALVSVLSKEKGIEVAGEVFKTFKEMPDGEYSEVK
ncbi:MAG: hypothetical protein AB1480_12625 [Nitrospirota bacterium]